MIEAAGGEGQSGEPRLFGAEAWSWRTALILLSEKGCSVCRFRDQSEDRFFAWFAIETYSQPPMVERLRASLGLCPAHTRRILRPDASHVPNFVYEHVVISAIPSLDRPSQREPCPACANQDWSAVHAADLIVANLHQGEVADAYAAAGGFCIFHLLASLPRADAVSAGLMAQVARRALGGDEADAMWTVAGPDVDAAQRHRLREMLRVTGSGSHVGSTTIGRLRARFEVDACPICFSAGAMARRYLRWLSEDRRSGSPSTDAVWLCPTHLAELGELDRDVVLWAGAGPARAWLGALARFDERLRTVPAPSFGARARSVSAVWRRIRSDDESAGVIFRRSATARRALKGALRRPDAVYREVLQLLLNERRPCQACSTLAATENRELALLRAGVKDRPTARAYERSHGLCLRHATSLPREAVPGVVGEVLSAHLAVLRWELEEASRKKSWSFRHEPSGPESTAWFRAPALLDGRVFEGGPAVPLPS